MKKLILLLFFVPLFCKAQLIIYGGPLYGFYGNKSFNQFATSYNTYLTTNNVGISKELKPFNTARGYNFGVGAFITEGLGFSFGFVHFASSTKAEFTDGSSRHFTNTINTPLTFGMMFKGGPVTFHPKFGFAKALIESYYEYPDGTISYGKDKILNGVFTTWDFFGELNLSIDLISTDFLLVDIGASAYGMPSKRNTYTDWNWGKSLNYTGTYPTGLPIDYVEWSNAGLGNYDVEKYVHPKSHFYYVFANVKLFIGGGD